jgi:hypothetical protein
LFGGVSAAETIGEHSMCRTNPPVLFVDGQGGKVASNDSGEFLDEFSS